MNDSRITNVVDGEKVFTSDGEMHVKSKSIIFNLMGVSYETLLVWSGEGFVIGTLYAVGTILTFGRNVHIPAVSSSVFIRATAFLAREGLL